MQKRKGFTLLELTIYLLIIGLLATSINYINPKPMVEAKDLKDKAVMLDESLSQWYQSHDLEYPDDLKLLQQYGGVPTTVKLDKFQYITSSDKKNYKLTVTLPDNTIYTSPNSNL